MISKHGEICCGLRFAPLIPIRPLPPPPPRTKESRTGGSPNPEIPDIGPPGEGGLSPPPPHGLFRLAPRISLFDAQRRLVAGTPSAPEDQLLQEITVDGATVGWLGVRKTPQLSHPLDVEFAEQQTKAFYLIGMVTLCAAILVSFFLSRHLLRPIKQLTGGTQALSQRKFETRITIHSRDELGQSGVGFQCHGAGPGTIRTTAPTMAFRYFSRIENTVIDPSCGN